MATPGGLGPFADRRLRFAAALGDALAIIPGAQEARRNGDVSYEFRQSSDFFFLTGFDEPDAVAVVNPAHTKERYVLFVRPRDRDLEIWTGHRAGVEGAVATYGADAAYPIDKLDDKLREYLVDRPVVYYRLGQGAFDGRVTRLVVELRGARARGYPAPVRLEDPGPILHEMRLRAEPRRPRRSDALRAVGALRVPGAGGARVRLPEPGLAAQRVPLDRRLGAQRVHPPLRGEHAPDAGRRAAPDRRRLRVGLPRGGHHPYLPRQRALHRPAARDLRNRAARAAGRARGRAAREPLRD